MNRQKKLSLIAGIIIVVIILLDQLLKIWVKTHMALGQTIPIFGDWLNLFFIENSGMAFGLSFGENIGKLMLSLFRIVLVVFLCWYMHKLIKKDKIDGLMLTIFSLIIAGALGNIIDCLFYGLAFGYAPFFYGKVVDMIYVKLFPIPESFPLWGGSYFFPAIFNIADSCITVGVFMVLIFNKRCFQYFEKNEENCSNVDENASKEC